MQRSRGITPRISEEEFKVDKFYGLNTFGPHADDKPGQFREFTNFDDYIDYIKERRGCVNFEDVSNHCPDLDIISKATFDTGDNEYAIIQQNNNGVSEFRSAVLNSNFAWVDILNKGTSNPFTIASSEKADMMASNGKLYIFHTSGNAIIEFDSATGLLSKRKMGLPALQINTITGEDLSATSGGISGKRIYAVELVYKDTTVSPAVDLIVSGPNRAKVVSSPDFGEGSLSYTPEQDFYQYQIAVSPTLNDGTAIDADENSNWTHARLYRTKDLTTATNATQGLEGEAEITGRPGELFQVQEMDKTTFLATLSGGFYYFAYDAILDDDMPFPLTVIQDERLELVPIPAASTGAYANNRVWASGISSLPGPGGNVSVPDIEGKIFYSPETDTKYSESMSPLSAKESDPGDGQKMIKLVAFQEDLVGIKEAKTGRIPQADPNSSWVTEDEVIGITNIEFAQYVPGIGICARVNDQSDFRIFGYDLRWTNVFAGQLISRPIRDIISNYTPADVDFIYINGKLIISGGKAEMLVLATEQQAGWSLYSYPFNGKSEAVFTFASGTRAMVINGNQVPIEIEAVDSDGVYVPTDYDPELETDTAMSVDVTTHKFSKNKGRMLIEERFVSISANASDIISVTPYSDGKQWQSAFNLKPDPKELPDAALRETEYQGYEEYRALGRYLHYAIHSIAPCTIYSIVLNAQIQRGTVNPNFDPFQILEDVNVTPDWTKDTGTITETGTATTEYTETGSATTNIIEIGE